MLERLWNGWRASYVAGEADDPVPPGEGSIFTRILRSGRPDTETHVVRRSQRCFVILNAYPYATGHLLVIPYREVADLEALEPAEATELWMLVTESVLALKAALHPEGLNVGINLGRPAGGSVSEHLHVHVVPRWTGDSNFMTTVASTRTIPEAIDATAARIRAHWPTAGSGSSADRAPRL